MLRAMRNASRPSGFGPMGRYSLAVLLAAAGLLMGPGAIEQLFCSDESVGRSLHLVARGLQAGALVMGLWVALRGLPGWLPRPAPALATFAAAALAIAGAYGTLLDLRIVNRQVVPLSGLRDLVLADPRSVLSEAPLAALEAERGRLRNEGAPAERVAGLEVEYATALLRFNKVDEAIAVLQEARRVARDAQVSEPLQVELAYALGTAFFRRGEVGQCVNHHNPARCLFPIAGDGVWSEPELALKAIACFEEILRVDPDHARARWLLNLAYMAAGGFPDQVPERYLLPESVVGGPARDIRFEDVASRVGLATLSVLGGAIVEDFDRDGLLDVMVSGYDPREVMRLFRNDGRGGFEDRTQAAGLSDQVAGFNLAQADYDNDGRIDVLVLRGGWGRREFGRLRNSLLRQRADGTFEDVSVESGIATRAYPTQTGAWADYDGDGDLDLYVGNEKFPCELFRNNGDGTFTDVARALGVRNEQLAKSVAWGDIDNDGDPDLYVSNHGSPNRLYRNEGDRFVDVAQELGVALAGPDECDSFVSWFFDADNDGWLDLFVAGYPASNDLGQVVNDYLGAEVAASGERLFLNDGADGFVDVSKAYGLHRVRFTMGANYGDIDYDGFNDIYLGTGAPGFDFLIPNQLYRNERGKGFTEISASAGVGHLQKGHGIAFGDLDNDGDQDLFAEMGGFFAADAFWNAAFENVGSSGNSWLYLQLVGTKANRSAIGARVRVTFREDGVERSVHTLVHSGGSFGASTLRAEIGVGRAQIVDELEIVWPGSGTRQRFEQVGVRQCLRIEEGAEAFEVVSLPRVKLGG